jgi:ribose transport system permease protein
MNPSSVKSLWRQGRSFLGLVGALLVMIALFSLLSRHFFSARTFTTIANQIPDLLVMSVGMTFVLVIGGIDLSVGSMLAFSGSVISVAALRGGWSPVPAAAAGVLAAGACGAVTGLVAVTWRVPSFIVSLGMLEIARGLAYRLTDSRTAYIGASFDWLGNPWALGITPAFVAAVALAVLAQWILSRTVFGRHATAIGTNEKAVRLAGVDPRPYQVAIFAASAALAGLAAVFQISRLEAADPNAGVGMELQAIAAAVIGGTSLMGGRASVISTMLGVLVIAVLEAGLAQVGASEPTKRIITGAVIVVAVVLDRYRTRGSR